MNAPKTSRRGLLGAIALSPMALAVPALASTATTPWRAARVKHEAALSELLSYDREIYEPAYVVWQARLDSVPHIAMKYKDGAGFDHEMRSDDSCSVKRTQHIATIPAVRRHEHPQFLAICDRFWAMLQEREAALNVIRSDPSFQAILNKSTELDRFERQAFADAMASPAVSLAEVAEKIELIEERGEEEEMFTNIAADVRRLAAGGLD